MDPNILDIKCVSALQALHMYSTLKRRGKVRFHVVSTWNTRGVVVESMIKVICIKQQGSRSCTRKTCHVEQIIKI